MRDFFKCDIGWSDHTLNPLLIYSVIHNYNASLIEFHLDLDGKYWMYIASPIMGIGCGLVIYGSLFERNMNL